MVYLGGHRVIESEKLMSNNSLNQAIVPLDSIKYTIMQIRSCLNTCDFILKTNNRDSLRNHVGSMKSELSNLERSLNSEQ